MPVANRKCAEVQQGRYPAAEKQKAKATAAHDSTVRDLAKATLAINPCQGIMLSALLGERPPCRQRLLLTR